MGLSTRPAHEVREWDIEQRVHQVLEEHIFALHRTLLRMTLSSASAEMRSPPGVTACVLMVWCSHSIGTLADCAARAARTLGKCVSQQTRCAACHRACQTHLKNLDDCLCNLRPDAVAGKDGCCELSVFVWDSPCRISSFCGEAGGESVARLHKCRQNMRRRHATKMSSDGGRTQRRDKQEGLRAANTITSYQALAIQDFSLTLITARARDAIFLQAVQLQRSSSCRRQPCTF